MRGEEIVIHGAGIMGLSLALELHRRGVPCAVVNRSQPGAASLAAAGMLAVEDPEHPDALRPMARLSAALYPEFLERVEALSGVAVPFETSVTLQRTEAAIGERLSQEAARAIVPGLAEADGFVRLEEHSLDPRRLHRALRAAVEKVGIRFCEPHADAITVDCMGAWSTTVPGAVRPFKGQMLRVMPGHGVLSAVVRTPEIYVVPRLDGSVVIGATVEEAGFSTETQDATLERMQESAARILPVLRTATRVEAWAGIRPGTVDRLPLIGKAGPGRFVATGHFRNGILLAPVTAAVVADIVTGVEPVIDVAEFNPARFSA